MLRLYSSDLTSLMEAMGLDMNDSPKAEFQRLRPRGLRLVDDPSKDSTHPSDISFLDWEGYDEEELSAEDSKVCFWDFIHLGSATSAELMDFVRKWGLFHFVGPRKSGSWPIPDFRIEVRTARDFLIALIATEHDELLPAEILETFADGDRPMIRELTDPPGVMRPDPARRAVADERRRRRWRRIRERGQGLDLQKTLLASFLDDKFSPALGWTVWDNEGRHNLRVETGVENIVWSYLYSFFLSPQLDVFICGTCGNPYPFDEGQAERRPRRGVRSFCSDSCKAEARRQSNRMSWSRNSHKWRGRGQNSNFQGNKEGPDGR